MMLSDMLVKIKQAPHIDFGELFGRSIDLFQKTWLQGMLLQVLIMVVSYGLVFIAYIPIIGTVFIVEEGGSGSGSEVGYAILGILTLLLILFILIVISVFQFCLQAAFYRIIRMKDRNNNGELGISFGMFIKKKHIKKVIVLSMAQVGITVIATLFFIIPLFYALVPLQFAIVIFAFNPDWSVNDIYKAAFTLGNKKWGITFGACVVIAILAMIVGFIACFIGVYATISIVYLPVYLIYKEVVGFTEDDDMIAQIGV